MDRHHSHAERSFITINSTATFGWPPPSGMGACTSNGLCKEVPSKLANAIAINLTFDTAKPGWLEITYSFAALQAQQPEQAATVSAILSAPPGGPTPTYHFGGDFQLSGAVFGQLGIAPTATILKTSNILFSINGDIVTMSIPFKG